MGIEVGADRPKLDPLSLDEGSEELGCRDHRVVPACFQAKGETEVGIEVPKRAERRDHNALTHQLSHFVRRPDYIAGGEAEWVEIRIAQKQPCDALCSCSDRRTSRRLSSPRILPA